MIKVEEGQPVVQYSIPCTSHQFKSAQRDLWATQNL